MTNHKSSADHMELESVWSIGARTLPPPSGASKVMYTSIANTPQPDKTTMQYVPRSEAEWLVVVTEREKGTVAQVPVIAKQLAVSYVQKEIEGVGVYEVTPAEVDPGHEKHLFIYLHGGGFMVNRGLASLPEAMIIASRAKMRVLSVDYRMPPEHQYPGATDDILNVYRILLSQQPAKSMAMGGSSAGGGLTLAAVQQMIQLGLDVPGALYAGTPASDLSRTGDSIYTNEGVDRLIPTYDGLIEAAMRMYAGDLDLKDPRVSPIYGDFNGFPPTFLVTGTRDLFLSNTARTHIKLRQAGAVADILVYEGVSHGDYAAEASSPESMHAYAEMNAFLLRHLQ